MTKLSSKKLKDAERDIIYLLSCTLNDQISSILQMLKLSAINNCTANGIRWRNIRDRALPKLRRVALEKLREQFDQAFHETF